MGLFDYFKVSLCLVFLPVCPFWAVRNTGLHHALCHGLLLSGFYFISHVSPCILYFSFRFCSPLILLFTCNL